MKTYEQLDKAATLARNLMEQHGLRTRGWTFDFNSNRSRLGLCRYNVNKIELSTHHVASGNWNEIENTILHEIAHALVGAGYGHGPVWKRKAIEIGCNGKRCGTMEAPSKYIVECPSCKRTIKRNRMAKRKFSCGVCSPNVYNERFLMVWRAA